MPFSPGNKLGLGREPWNKGLTKEDDVRLVRIGQFASEFHKGRKRGPINVKHRKALIEAQKKVNRSGEDNPFYGRKHTLETRVKMRGFSGMLGKKHSAETKKRMRATAKKRFEDPEVRAAAVAILMQYTGAGRSSKLSDLMLKTFLSDFPEARQEEGFGRYRVDAYILPPYHLAFEAGGEYWHSLPGRQEYDAARDAYLLEKYNLPVIRLTEAEIHAAAEE